ncbi:MBL fold metallo-hydrolase [Nitratireductor kimnyeongensis]|uniref:MBL fold metallo-hydrolase n=1 Tax=Nitratireductor kimnyeongensis TaxID=430679 RepID=A0ABW0T506_9HYPH|nr:MBL fold metallo-hydrolase [Nitratireductor kimnyeongensis]QZZ34742.1 MBL fold metallo-hydrolase [Nitratireductor kimnyeongensis]
MHFTRRNGLKFIAAGAAAAVLPVMPASAASPATADKGTRLILLGTGGGPTPLPNRNQPASVLLVNDEPYVIDAGNGVARQLMLAGIGSHRIGKIFITHHHDDHNADMGTLMGLAWSNGRAVPSDAFGPPGTEAMVRAFVDYFEPNSAVRRAFSGGKNAPSELFRGHDVAGSGFVYEDENVRVTCVENTHYPNQGHKDGVHHVSYAYRFETADRVIVFSGDTAVSEELAGLTKGADVLVHEVINVERTGVLIGKKFAEQGRSPEEIERVLKAVIAIHTPLEDVGRLAEGAGVKTLVLNHFVPGFDPEETPESWVAGIRAHYAGEIIVGEDLMVI